MALQSRAATQTHDTGAAFMPKISNQHGEFSAWQGVAAESAIMNDETVNIGIREGWGQNSTFGIQLPELRHHMYVIGKTGSGKTTLLRNLIVQHIALGHGVGVIDPHGDLAEEILRHIPSSRADHLVYFNPADLEFPIGLNLLANVSQDERHLVASGIVGAFKSIWHDSWGPRMEYILYNAVAALLECSNTSLLGINRLLTDADYRASIIRQIKDPFIKEFWEQEYAAYEPRFQREAIAPIQNKIGQLLLTPVIRNILGQVKRKISFPFIMDEGRIFIGNIAKGRIGHDKANLLGSLLVTQFQLAAMARSTQPESRRRDFVLFIDEFQNFATDTFQSILAEARKYRLCLVLSHQYVDQIPLPLRQAVFGNVGSTIAFRVGQTDATVLEKEFGNEMIARQFVDLNRHEVVVKIMENGQDKAPFKGSTLAPVENIGLPQQRLIDHCRQRFSTQRKIVEEKLGRWTGHSEATSPSDWTPRKRQNPRPVNPSPAPKRRAVSEARKN